MFNRVKYQLLTLIFLQVTVFLHAQDKEAFRKRASEFYEKKDYVQALFNINAALKIDPDNEDYLLLKGNTLFELDRYQQAYEVYSRVVTLYPFSWAAYNQRGLLHLSVKEYDVAINDFTRAMELPLADTVCMSFFLNRAVVYAKVRKFEHAYNDLTMAQWLVPNEITVLNNLATVTDELGRRDETLRYLRKVIEIDSSFIGGFGNLGFAYSTSGQCDSALVYFGKALKIDPEDAYLFNNRGYCYYQMGLFDLAMNDVNKSISKLPGNSYAFRNRALIYLALKDQLNACNDLDQARQLGFTMNYGNEVDSLLKIHCKTVAKMQSQ